MLAFQTAEWRQRAEQKSSRNEQQPTSDKKSAIWTETTTSKVLSPHDTRRRRQRRPFGTFRDLRRDSRQISRPTTTCDLKSSCLSHFDLPDWSLVAICKKLIKFCSASLHTPLAPLVVFHRLARIDRTETTDLIVAIQKAITSGDLPLRSPFGASNLQSWPS